MCNRFQLDIEWREIRLHWDIMNDLPQFKPVYNASPGRKEADLLAIVCTAAGNDVTRGPCKRARTQSRFGFTFFPIFLTLRSPAPLRRVKIMTKEFKRTQKALARATAAGFLRFIPQKPLDTVIVEELASDARTQNAKRPGFDIRRNPLRHAFSILASF